MVFDGWQGAVSSSSSQSTTVLMDSPKSVTATWRADATVLYLTIILVVAAVGVVAWIGAHMWSRRNKTGTQWQPSPPVQSTQTTSAPTASNVDSAGSDAPSTAKSNVRRHRRNHPAAPVSESSSPEGTSAPGTEE